MLRIPHCLDNRLADGGKVVSPTHRPRSTPQKYFFSVSSTHFCYRLSETQGPSAAEELGKIKKFIHLIGCAICEPTVQKMCDPRHLRTL
jgi:hypothetical protein